MLSAHLPAGYLVARAWPRPRPGLGPGIMAAALAGAMFPDLDMAWWYVVDHGWVHHHEYWTHTPAAWGLVGGIGLLGLRRAAPKAVPLAAVFLVSIFVHLILDSMVGAIGWLWPWDDRPYALFDVPPTRSHWVWSFMLHWTFLAEVAIWFAALGLLLRNRSRTRHAVAGDPA